VTASTNPWSQVYKLAAGKTRANNIMTTLRKPGSLNIEYTGNNVSNVEYHFPEDREEEESQHHKTCGNLLRNQQVPAKM
jgi:hypothetical protein